MTYGSTRSPRAVTASIRIVTARRPATDWNSISTGSGWAVRTHRTGRSRERDCVLSEWTHAEVTVVFYRWDGVEERYYFPRVVEGLCQVKDNRMLISGLIQPANAKDIK